MTTTMTTTMMAEPQPPNRPQMSKARKEKKRAADRECQRQARARTKTKIAQLEAAVAELSSHTGNEAFRDLMNRLDDSMAENAALRRKLQSIGSIAQSTTSTTTGTGMTGTTNLKRSSAHTTSKGRPPSPENIIYAPGAVVADDFLLDDLADTTGKEAVASPFTGDDATSWFSGLPNLLDFDFPDPGEPPDTCTMAGGGGGGVSLPATPNPIDMSMMMMDSPNHHHPVVGASDDAVTAPDIPLASPYPQSPSLSSCGTTQSHTLCPQSHLWRDVSKTLLKWSSTTKQTQQHQQQQLQQQQQRHVVHRQMSTGAEDDDIIVRAVMNGWDSLDSDGDDHDQGGTGTPPPRNMGLSLRILREVDDRVWSSAAPVDRLAVLSMMNRLLRCHFDPNPANLAEVPMWYRARPSQLVRKHLYAVDFFVWPGLRERFVYNQHRYCSDAFWSLMTTNFRFVWPYDFRDCYIHNRLDKSLQLSDRFLARLNDLSSFSFLTGMFEHFPEFDGDVVRAAGSLGSLSVPLSLPVPRMGRLLDAAAVTGTPGRRSSSLHGGGLIDDKAVVDQRQLFSVFGEEDNEGDGCFVE